MTPEELQKMRADASATLATIVQTGTGVWAQHHCENVLALADEVERLRDGLDRSNGCAEMATRGLEATAAELERLRAERERVLRICRQYIDHKEEYHKCFSMAAETILNQLDAEPQP